ncbi:MAG: potassium channel family protein [Rickettsiales bacterium]|nr:potassium channel family protein [Rickettsiales bacterium]
MFSFFAMSAISFFMICMSCLMTYEILGHAWKWMPMLTVRTRVRVMLLAVPVLLAHILSIWMYGLAYFLIEHFTEFGGLKGHIEPAVLTYHSFVERLYFSATTYTSLGFGDIVPTHDMRMLSSAEVLNGLLMIAWTASFTYLSMETFWPISHRGRKKED